MGGTIISVNTSDVKAANIPPSEVIKAKKRSKNTAEKIQELMDTPSALQGKIRSTNFMIQPPVRGK
jgi:hypothetical protein